MLVRTIVLLMAAFLAIAPVGADPLDITLFQWLFNVNGTIYDSSGVAGSNTLPANISVQSGSPLSPLDPNPGGGLGVVRVEFATPGTHNLIAFFDHEIRQTLNGFSNETAAAVGALPGGLSYDAGEPGFFTAGEVYTNTLAGALTNTVYRGPDNDYALALGWSFNLGIGDSALILLSLSETAPLSGFYLQQTDPDPSGVRNVYYSTSLSVQVGPPPPPPPPRDVEIPEPGHLGLFAMSICAVAVVLRRRRIGRIASDR